ncbi:MAG: phosphonate ABC transporter ATP-binding protein [Magnetovibrio sp.]|nr:phosphonate ABC transporter ATP-binding protein [Magnetovibrio sp.]
MLKFEALTKEFGQLTAVDSIDLEVPKGQMLGVIGRSGAGKSTLLRMINRLNDATSGKILYEEDGKVIDVNQLTGQELRNWRAHCAMIFQQFNLVLRLNVITNVLMGRINYNSMLKTMIVMFSPAERAFAIRALDRLDVSAQALQRADTLSGGQQQRVAIARALVQEPKILLADEPIASLDPRNAQIVMEALRTINQEDGITVICNLHTLDTAKKYCDRVIGMKLGKMIFDGHPSELTDEMARDIYMGGDEEDEEFSAAITSTSLEN